MPQAARHPVEEIAPGGKASHLASRLEKSSFVIGIIIITIAGIALAGWILNLSLLKSVVPGFATMKVNTALSFVLTGLSLCLLSRGKGSRQLQLVAQGCAALVVAISILSLIEYLADLELGLDELFLSDTETAPEEFPGRMSPATALCFIFSGSSLYLLGIGRYKEAQILSLLTIFCSLLALAGYLYNFRSLYRVFIYSSMALHTAFSFMLLGTGILLARPETAMMEIINSESAGGYMARRLLPTVTLTPVILGLVILSGQKLEKYDHGFGISLLVLLTVVILWILVFWNARSLYLLDHERKMLSEQLQQAQKLESVGRLASGMAHDFNNLLVPILGYTDLELVDAVPESKHFYNLQQIRQAAERAANLTRQILTFSRQQMLDLRQIDLNTVTRNFEPMLRRMIMENIELRILLAPNLSSVEADKGQVEQVIMNLVINSSDALVPNGGLITIETNNVYLDEQYAALHDDTQPGPYVMLAVSDNGHGMNADTVRHIFDPFFTTKEQGKGTGLGLATVFGIVKQHRGNIWVYSEPGCGTTFKIYFPQSGLQHAREEPANVEPVSLQGTETILVAEDDEPVRQLVCKSLAAHGYQVLEAASPEIGLKLAAEHRREIHLLLTDLIMPKINGRQMYLKMKKLHPEARVLYMSGYTGNIIVEHDILSEKANFLQKPFSIQELAKKVREALR